MRDIAKYLDQNVPSAVREKHSSLIETVPIYIENWVNSTLANGNGPSIGYRKWRYKWANLVFKNLSRWMGSPLNPMLEVAAPRGESEPHRPLTETELTRLYTVVFAQLHRSHTRMTTSRDRAVIALLADHGLRPAHIARADLRHLHRGIGPYGRHMLALPSVKGGRGRLLELSDRATRALDACLHIRGRVRKDAPLLTTVHGDRLTSQTIREIVHRYARRAGLSECTPYTLRRTFAQRIARTCTIDTVRRELLHTTLDATIKYLDRITPLTAGADLARNDDPLGNTP